MFCFTTGGGAVFMSAVVAAGTLSPPYFLARQYYKYHKRQNSSKAQRRLSVVAAASLGVITLPFLSLWGISKTFKIAKNTTVEAFDQWLDEYAEEEDPEIMPQEYLNAEKTEKSSEDDNKIPKSSSRTKRQLQELGATQDEKESSTPENAQEGNKRASNYPTKTHL